MYETIAPPLHTKGFHTGHTSKHSYGRNSLKLRQCCVTNEWREYRIPVHSSIVPNQSKSVVLAFIGSSTSSTFWMKSLSVLLPPLAWRSELHRCWFCISPARYLDLYISLLRSSLSSLWGGQFWGGSRVKAVLWTLEGVLRTPPPCRAVSTCSTTN